MDQIKFGSQNLGHWADNENFTCILALPDRYLLTGSKEGNIRIWNPNKNEYLHTANYPIGGIKSLKNSHAGSIVIHGTTGIVIFEYDNFIKRAIEDEGGNITLNSLVAAIANPN